MHSQIHPSFLLALFLIIQGPTLAGCNQTCQQLAAILVQLTGNTSKRLESWKTEQSKVFLLPLHQVTCPSIVPYSPRLQPFNHEVDPSWLWIQHPGSSNTISFLCHFIPDVTDFLMLLIIGFPNSLLLGYLPLLKPTPCIKFPSC